MPQNCLIIISSVLFKKNISGMKPHITESPESRGSKFRYERNPNLEDENFKSKKTETRDSRKIPSSG